MGKYLMFLPPLVFAALALMFWVGMERGETELPSTMIGRAAPAVQLGPLADLPLFEDAQLRAPGIKLVNFFASWCAPCRAEHPMLKKLADEGVTIYGINYKDKPDQAIGFLNDLGNPYAAIGTDEGRLALDWGVYGVPETYVIDGTGKIVLRIAGPITAAELERSLRPAIAAAQP